MNKMEKERYDALCVELSYLLGISFKKVQEVLNELISGKR